MTTPPKDTRGRILLEAAMLFADRGFDAPSVREICEAAEVSKPTLYYYFESKSGLITAVVNTLHNDFEHLIAELFDPTNASIEGCIAGYTRLFDRIEEQGWTVRLWSRVPALSLEEANCAARERKAEAHFAAYLMAMPELEASADVEAAVWLLLASFGPIAMHKQLEPIPLSNAILAERLVRQALGVTATHSSVTEDTP